MITGMLRYEERSCVFKLNTEKFLLEIEEMEERELGSFPDFSFLVDSYGKTVAEDILLVGEDFENNKKIHFNVRNLKSIGVHTYRAHLNSYLIFVGAEISFDGLQIQSKELNHFYNLQKSFDYTFNFESGEIDFKMGRYVETTRNFEFDYDGQTIEGEFNVSRNILNSSSPIILRSTLNYYFFETKELKVPDFLFLLTEQLFKFVTYRTAFYFDRVVLIKSDPSDNKYFKVGELFVFQPLNESIDRSTENSNRIIDYSLLEDSFSNLLEKLSKKQIYLRHLPRDLKEASNITPARFIMVTAGFEWEFQFLHEELSRSSKEKYQKETEEILNFLQGKIDITTGDSKKFFKSFKSLVSKNDSSLSDKLFWTLEEFKDVIEGFIKRLYRNHGISENRFQSRMIADRIANQRNKVAHGNLNQDVDTLYILDFLVLEWLYYSMVLHDIGMTRSNIKKSINKLFNLGHAD